MADATPADRRPADVTPADRRPADATLADATLAKVTPADAAHADAASAHGAPARTAFAVARRFRAPDHGVHVALAVLLVFNLLFTPNFATIGNLRLQLVQVA